MDNNEVQNNVEELSKDKKKTAIILVIGLVTFILVMSIGIGIFWIKSFDGTSKTGNTKSPFTTNTNSNK